MHTVCWDNNTDQKHPQGDLDVKALFDWLNHFGGQNNVNKITAEVNWASKMEESGQFISIKQCQKDQRVTTALSGICHGTDNYLFYWNCCW